MKKLSKKQILMLHTQLIQQTGGSEGVRDYNLLDSALETPFQSFGGDELYPTIQAKAARLGYGLIKNHCMCNLLEYLTQRDIQTKNSGVNVRYRGKHRFFKGFNEFIKEKTRRCDNDFEKIERHVFF